MRWTSESVQASSIRDMSREEPGMTSARDVSKGFRFCSTPTRHPNGCGCPVNGRETETVSGLDRWDDERERKRKEEREK